MPRGPRLQTSGLLSHVIARGNNKEAIFWEPQDYRHYLSLLRRYQKRFQFQLYAFALMTNHLHLLIEQSDAPLSQIMQCVQTSYAAYCNRKYGRVGHLFQGRYHSVPCQHDSHLLELTRYIHLNPVRAGLVTHPLDYPWSSYRAYLGRESNPSVSPNFVLSFFGLEAQESRQQYSEFVESFVSDQSEFAGSTDIYRLPHGALSRTDRQTDSSKITLTRLAAPQGRRVTVNRPPLSDLIAAVAGSCQIHPSRMIDGHRRHAESRARSVALYMARDLYRYSATELSGTFHISLPAISKAIMRVHSWQENDNRVPEIIEDARRKLTS